MMKRTLSFLLCLIMVLGHATPAAQASTTDNSSVSNILDGIYIPEGADGTVIVNGEDVTEEVKKNTFDNLPSPNEMTTPTTAPSTPAAVDLCKCVDLPTAEDHPGVCKVKAPYIALCSSASEPELYAKWASFSYDEQAFMRAYLQQTSPLKLVELERLLSVPNSSASETLSDGTTVSVEGIPEYSSLTVGEAADKVKDIVDAYVAENEAASTELFSYDVSVQDAEGADWQPNATVKMELELPGQKLHKYSKVYVVHVDDYGVATTIEAEVTEDGKIAFETPGFSTFVGFTVDFEFNGIQISIPGMSSIKLSELLDSLKMPLYAEDVIDVAYTDDTQLKIEQLEGDWLLTSLKAFTTEEKLTLFMADGAVYEIKVTDAIAGQRADCYFAYNGDTGNTCYIDVSYYSTGDHNGVVTIKVADNTGNSVTTNDNASSYYANSNWWNRRVVIDGNGISDNISDGATEFCIEKNGTGNYFKVPVVNWYITGGATVNVYLEGFDSDDTISFESWVDGSPLITVDNGTLYFNVDSSVLPKDASTTSGYIRNFHVTQCSYKEIFLDGYDNVEDNEDAIIFADDSAKAVFVNDVEFINSARRAVYIRADQMSEFRMDNCIFDSTITSTNGGGGAVYIAETTSGGAWVNVDKLTFRYCEFDQQKVGSTEKDSNGKIKVVRGGAILVWGNLDNTYFYHCKFYKTNATAQGGAVAIGNQANTFNQGDITFENCEFDGTTNDNSLAGAVLICQLANNLKFENCIFKNITGAGHGGVLHIGGTDDVAIAYASFEMTGCSFTNCKTTGGRGGALRLNSTTANPVTITDCTFSTCSASSLGGALSFQGNIGTLTISGTAADKSSFSGCVTNGEAGGAISLDATITKCEIKDTSFSTCKAEKKSGGAIYHGGTTGDLDINNCSFTSCQAQIYGGAIALYGRTTTTDITGGSFTTCKAGGTQAMYASDKVTPIYDKKGNHMYNGTGGGAAIIIVQNHGTVNIGGTSTKNQTFTNCESLNNGGAISFEGDCEVQNCNIQYVSIDGCKARDSGSAILLGDVTVVNMSIMDSEIKNCSYVSGYTGTDAIKNTLYDEDYTEGMDYDSIMFRTNDSHGTIRTIGSCKAQLVVENVDFTNNTSVTGGGGIYWNANRVAGYMDDKDGTYTFTNSLTIKNCDFTGNKAFRDGGAIYVEASLTVQGGTFKNNSAQRGGAIAQQIYNNADRPIQSGETNNMIITTYTSGTKTTGAVFEENYARKHGGAISLVCNATGSITTTADAAAMAYPITCDITSAEMKNNRAAENGGGVYFYQMSYPDDYTASQLKDSTTGADLTAEQIAAKAALDNKEVEGYVKSLILNGVSIHNNYAGCGKDNLNTPANANGSGNGGGIYLKAKENTTLNVLGCDIYGNNTHDGNGGGVFMTGTNGTCTIKSSDTIMGTDGKPKNTVIGGAADKANIATSAAPDTADGLNRGNGGGVAIFGNAKIIMENGTVSYNSADIAGGGIAINTSTMKVTGGTVTHNQALYGGGISLVKSGKPDTIVDESEGAAPNAAAEWGMEFTNGSVTDNVATIGGGICLSNSSTMKLSGGDVLRNYAATKSGSSYTYANGQNGGGIAVTMGSKMNIYSGQVNSNHAYNGGGITVQGGSALQMLPTAGSDAAGTVSSNTASSHGGGIYLKPKDEDGNKNTLYIDNGTIQSNTAYHGGGIAVMANNESKLDGGLIDRNIATYHGGGAYLHGAKLTISGGELSTNRGSHSGGAVYLRTTPSGEGTIPSELSITNGEIHDNYTTSGWGGAIYMYGSNSKTTITGGKIYKNRTEASDTHGGGINAEWYSTLTIEGGEIYENYATGLGGGLHIYNYATANIKGGEIRNNTSDVGGGGLAVNQRGVVEVTTSNNGQNVGKIMNNTSAKGGGVYVYLSGQLTVNNGYIINNKAVGTPEADVTTGYQKDAELLGAGGGVFVATGWTSSSKSSAFTLKGEKIAIYGNTADFIGDDVFSNGSKTQLTIPTVVTMDLADYDFQAEGWVEDYCDEDEFYTTGLNMINLHADRAEAAGNTNADEIREMDITRYRSTPSTNRKYMLVEPEYVSGKNADNTEVSGVFANQANAYVCVTLGIPGASDDAVVLDYGTTVNVNLIDNDLFIDPEDFANSSELGQGIPSGVKEKYGINYSSAVNADGTAVDHLGTFSGTDLWNTDWLPELKNGAAFLNEETGIITYNYNYGNGKLSFDAPETFAYTVKHGTSWFYAKITIVPATTIYYEDSASQVKYHTDADSKESLATWETVGQSLGTPQDQDRPGEALIGSLDADSIYGYDSNRGNTTTYSDGGAHWVTVSHEHNAEDSNGDDICDKCKHSLTHAKVDIIKDSDGNTDELCDVCGIASHTSHSGACTDSNKNWFCDICGKRLGRPDANGRASFTFTGTGFDIISYCSAKTGIVMASVYKGKNIDFDTIADDVEEFEKKYVASYIVDTYYGYKQDSNGDWVLDAESEDCLYQVPVIKADLTKVVVVQDDHNTKDVDETVYKNYGYGTYTVELYVAPSFLEREAGYWGADFYLDAIRIYNPAGDESGIYVTDEPELDEDGEIVRDQYGQPVFKTTTVDNSTIRDIHKTDKEGWPVYTELRNMFINQKNLGVTTTDGIIFIDGKTEASVADYTSWGPNNEVYLNKDESIAFTMDMQGCTNVAAIHIGMRGLKGMGRVTIAYGTSAADAFPVLTDSLSTTDMYYGISMKDSEGNFLLANKVVVITNSGTKPIAISNVKVTHTAAPTYQTTKTMFKVSKRTAEVALEILNAEQLSEPTVTPKYPALSFNGMICYNVFFTADGIEQMTPDKLGLAVFDSYEPEGTVETAKDVIMGATEVDGLFMVATNGVNAKYLGDTQYFRAFAKQADGSYVYSPMVSYSALDYAKNVLSKSNDPKLKQLVVAMLNYGAEAQKFFGYKTDDLMNRDLTAEDQALLEGIDVSSLNSVGTVDPAKVGAFASTGGFTRRSPAISFNGAFEINYFFTPANALDGDFMLYFWSEDTYNSVTELTAENADKVVELVQKNGSYTAVSDEIIARELDKTLYVAAVYQSGDETYCSGVLPYSIAAYCQKPPADVQALATAAGIYGCTAKQYFGE